MARTLTPFHIAVPVHDIEAARKFYGDVMGFAEGRSADTWVDFNFYGHQFVIHLQPGMEKELDRHHRNPVDGHDVPVPHYGAVLEWHDWEALAERLKSKGIKFMMEPCIRFKGLVGEQATMFLLDPSNNALEFKAFKDIGQLFAK
jgi:extradiol dioxygenase family protein